MFDKNKYMHLSMTPAVVLGSSITTLGVLRCLGLEKIPTFYLTNHDNYITHSRWCHARKIVSENLSHPQELAQILESLPFTQAVLFPCSDSLLLAVASLAPNLKARFLTSIADLELLQKLLDKAELARILRSCKVPHPQTFVVATERDLKDIKEAQFNNAFLKPRDSHLFFKHYGVKAFLVQNREDAIAKAGDIQRAGYSLVLQEYIPGPKSNHYFIDGFVDREGEIKALFARRRIRMYPPDFGNSSYMYSVPLSEVSGAVETLRTLFSTLAYRGIFSAEFKFDERDGLFKVIEINVRPWWYVEFAATCGINVCKLAYQDALGQDTPHLGSYKVGTSLVYFYYDQFACWQQFREHKLSLRSWLRSWWNPKCPIYRPDDPLPAMVKSLNWLGGFFRRRISGR